MLVSHCKEFYDLIKGYKKGRLLVLIGAVIVQALVGIVAVSSVAPLMTVVFNGGKETTIAGFQFSLLELLLIFVASQFLLFVANLTAESFRLSYVAKVNSSIRTDCVKFSLRKEYSYFANNDSGFIQKVVNEYPSQVGYTVGYYLELLSKGLSVLCLIGVAILLDPYLAVIITAVGAIYYFSIARIFNKLRNKLKDDMQKYGLKTHTLSLQIIQGMKMMKIFKKGDYFTSIYHTCAKKYAESMARSSFLAVSPKFFMELMLMITLASYIWYLSKTGNLNESLPRVGALAFVAYRIFPLLQGAYHIMSNMHANYYMIERVQELLGAKDVIEPSTRNLSLSDSISFKGASFKFPGADKDIVFPDLSIKKGEIVGVVGESGSGKSTLLNILLGLYECDGVELDGKTAKGADFRAMYDEVGYVGQNPYVLNATVYENITLSKSQSEEEKEKVRNVCEMANVSQHIESLPKGYDSSIGDRGLALSGGQIQRLAIARALYKDPSILYFDEATSALDAETEKRVMDVVYSLPRDITIVMIAHRLSTLERADKIIRFAN